MVGVVDAFLYDGLFVGVEFGVEAGTGEDGAGDEERFWIDVDLDNLEGGWANAGRDFLVDRARGDCDMAYSSPSTKTLLRYWVEYRGSLGGSMVEERKIKIKTNDALESHLMTSRPN